MENNTVWVPFDLIERFMTDAFIALGVPADEAATCADVLIEADRRGIDSHGANRFKPIYYDRIRAGIQFARTDYEIVREGPTTLVVDGHHGMGMVVAKRAMQSAIDKARLYGMGMAVVRNSTHYGIAGYYATMATSQGMIGITGTNARPSIAPTFGVENMLGTNPLTVGIPTDEDFPFVLDCATSIVQRGKIEYYARVGKDTPAGQVIDHEGRIRTDSEGILEALTQGTAALTPLGGAGEEMGGYKGYGYATVVEILSAALQQGSYLKMLTGVRDGKKVPYGLGHFFLAIDVAAFTDPADFRKTSGEILRELRASQKAPGHDRIFTAGEKEYETRLYRQDKGVPFNAGVMKEFIEVRDALGLVQHRFPFE
ncbi:MAG: Ldh family oxidoreductase [Clostridia bacterium]|nr:Ldh family oxidoreductase [Clostridia bacterium]